MTILNFTSVSSGEETYVFNANSGATGWGGLASITNYSGCTILRATAQVNTYYYASTSISARGVHCQEVGHTFGLDHSNDGGCMGGGYWYDIATHYRPVSHNVSDIGSMYANRIATFPTVGPEVNAPKIHAYWVNNPRSLRETTKLSSDVVVATVTGISNGKPIVSRSEDGTYVQRIPTQRVSFTVMDSRKGDLGENESFVLFQNGDFNNRFDEDPSYKIGATYLMFLTPRADGTYMVVAPSGRYEISQKGLVPAAKDGFATTLQGAAIEDVIRDVQGALEQ